MLILIIGLVVFLLLRSNRKEQKNRQQLESLRSLAEKYPHAFYQKFHLKPTQIGNSNLEIIHQASEWELKKLEEEIHYQTKQREFEEKFALIEKKYPLATKYYQNNLHKSKEVILCNEGTLAETESFLQGLPQFELVVTTQNQSEESLYKYKNESKILNHFEVHQFEVQYGLHDFVSKYRIRIPQLWAFASCQDTSLDYSFLTDEHQSIVIPNVLSLCKQCKISFADELYDGFFDIIKSFSSNLVLLSDSGLSPSTTLNRFHFSRLIDKLDIVEGITCYELDNDTIIQNSVVDNIFIVEFISTKERIIQNCNRVFQLSNNRNLHIYYLSVVMEVSSSEMSDLLVKEITKIEQEKRVRIIKEKYPHAFEQFIFRHPSYDAKEIIQNESLLKKNEASIIIAPKFKSLVNAQKEYDKQIHCLFETELCSIGVTLSSRIIKRNIIIEGERTEFEFYIPHLYLYKYCQDTSLDYTLFPNTKHCISNFSRIKNNEISFPQKAYDRIISVVKCIPDVLVIFSNSGGGSDNSVINDFHFKYLRLKLDSLGIPYCNNNSKEIGQSQLKNVVIVELITLIKSFHPICYSIWRADVSNEKRVAYLSVLNELTSKEMSDLIEKKELIELQKRNNDKTAVLDEIKSPVHRSRTSPILKKNANDFKEYLEQNDVRFFFHFTDKRNLKSIKENGGLLSWKYCEEHNIQIENAGGDETSRFLDTKHKLEDYVRLSFCTDHPMAWRLKQDGCTLVLLKIKVDVAWLQGTLFSDINAADNAHHHGPSLDDLKRVDINATRMRYLPNTSEFFKKHQAEVLVKTHVPLEYIVNIDDPYII